MRNRVSGPAEERTNLMICNQLFRYSLWLFMVFALSMMLTPSALAQSAGTGALTGTVTDATAAIIPGVTVTLTSTDTNQTRSMITSEDGSYRFALLPPDNSTGNFVKVTQRVPVKIIPDDAPGAARLRPGMSAVANVRIARPDRSDARQVASRN